MVKRLSVILSMVLILLSGCSRHSNKLTIESLKNGTYTLDSFSGMKVTLKDGRFDGHPGAQDESEFSVGMLDLTVFGEIQGRNAAAVVLYSNSGGTGTFIDLALVLEKDNASVNVASINLGDRVRVNHVSIDRDTIQVNMTIHGPEDPMCCPTLDVQRSFVLRDTVLIEPNAPKNPEPEDPE